LINSKSKTLIPDAVKKKYLAWLEVVVTYVLGFNLHPNLLSFIGFSLIIISVGFIVSGYLHIAAGIMLLAGIFDNIDGLVARKTHTISKFGALLDSTLDRASEFLFLAGTTYFFIRKGLYPTAVAASSAACFSFLVSYIRARAEGLGFICDVGFLQREERVALLGITGVLHTTLFIIVVWFTALASLLTVVQRLLYIWKEDEKQRKKIKDKSMP
jgi:CDP-diacylglycerol--glycerol-3-phosphate 3-phosphatidyltransferase